MESILRASGLKKYYGTGETQVRALDGVDISIEEGEFVALVGSSGSGKSTLLNMLGGLDTPTKGDVLIRGQSLKTMKRDEKTIFRRRNIGFVFQFHHLLPEFTALENVCIPAWIKGTGKKEAELRAMELLTLLGLADRMSHKPNQLSGGEQQRISVARALVNHPRVVLADEPSGNLDTRTKNELHQLFFTLREELGQTFVIVTHDTELARMSDRQIKLNDGMLMNE